MNAELERRIAKAWSSALVDTHDISFEKAVLVYQSIVDAFAPELTDANDKREMERRFTHRVFMDACEKNAEPETCLEWWRRLENVGWPDLNSEVVCVTMLARYALRRKQSALALEAVRATLGHCDSVQTRQRLQELLDRLENIGSE